MTSLAVVFLLFATVLEFDTSRIPEGDVAAQSAGNRTVKVENRWDATIVRVEEGERVDTITIRRQGRKIGRITRSDNGKPRPFMAMDRPRVVVDGIDLEPFLTGAEGEWGEPPQLVPPPQPPRRRILTPQREYVCPKDGAVLRVPPNAPNIPYKCPIDGTPMKAGVGPMQQYWLLE